MNLKPVIFLAFANDKVDNAAYLRNLSLEQHGIRKALEEAVSKGLCNRLNTIETPFGKSDALIDKSMLHDCYTPQGAYLYFKSNSAFQKSTGNTFFRKYWHKLLEWLKLE